MDDQEKLFDAIRRDETEIVRSICSQGLADLNGKDKKHGYTPLGAAALFGFTEIVELLCESSTVYVNEVDDKDEYGAAPLCVAAREGHVDTVEYLCSLEGIDVNKADNEDESPLNKAASFDHILTTKALCAAKDIQLNYRGKNGRSPLCEASLNGHLRIVEYLCNVQGVDVNHTATKGMTPLLLASLWKRCDVVQYLCQLKTVEVNKRNDAGETALHCASRVGVVKLVETLIKNDHVEPFIENKRGQTPFDVAVQKKHYQIALMLARKNLEAIYTEKVNEQYKYGETLLHMAVIEKSKEDLEYLCKIPGVKNIPNKTQKTPFDLAADEPNCPLSFLLALYQIPGARVDDINRRYNSEKTLLHIAAENNNIDALENILSRAEDVEVDVKDDDGNTALHYASLNGNLPMVRLLNDSKSSCIKGFKSVKNNEGYTPFDLAIMSGNVELLNFFFEQIEKSEKSACKSAGSLAKIDVNRQFDNGDTLLHIAVNSEKEEMVKYLCNIPGTENIKNNQDQTPFDIASKSETCPLACLLYLYFLPGATIENINRQFKEGKTLLHIAVEEHDEHSVKRLCSTQGIRNCKDFKQNTPFSLALKDKTCPKSFLLYLHKLPGADLDSINERLRGGKTLLHIAVEENDIDVVKDLLSNNADINVNEKDNEKNTILQYSVRNGFIDITSLILTHKTVDVCETYEDGKSVFWILRKTLEDKLLKSDPDVSEANRTNVHKILDDYLTEETVLLGFQLELKKLMEHEKPPFLKFLDQRKKDFDRDEMLQNVSLAINKIIVKGLQEYAEDKNLRFVFLKKHVLEISLQILINQYTDQSMVDDDNSDNNMAQIFRFVYMCLQANNECKVKEKELLKNSYDSDYDQDLIKRFKVLITGLAKIDKEHKNQKCSEVQLIARSIYAIYIKEEGGGCFFTLNAYLKKAKDCFAKCFGINRLYHKCSVRGYFAFIPCFIFIGIHMSDFITDFLVGFKTLNGFSTRLGIFMIALAIFTLIQENIRSHITEYEMEERRLQYLQSKNDLIVDDWEKFSNQHLHSYARYPVNHVLRFLWPYKVFGTEKQGLGSKVQSFRSLAFNLLSILMLRPAKDRLVILTHFENSIRELYIRKSEEMSQRQYYMIIEQIPELIVQFYLFLIFWNNMTKVELDQSECLTTSRQNFSYTPNNISYFECKGDLFGLKVCISTLELYSMIIPFVKIPMRTVALEKMFRKLDPTMPNMSTTASLLLYLTYIMMVPSRLFLFAAVAHSAPNHFYVVAYAAFTSIIWILMNFYFFSSNDKGGFFKTINNLTLRDCLSKIISLMPISFRDMWVISLREPTAYIERPSKVKYDSLRSWEKLMVISLYFFIEGLFGAIYVEHRFPCGRNLNAFRYQGWFYLMMLIYSLTAIIMISFTLQPRKINSLHTQFRRKSVIFCAFGMLLWFIASTFFSLSENGRGFNEKAMVAAFTAIFSVMLIVTVSILKRFGEAKKNKKRENEMKERSENRTPAATFSNYIFCECICSDKSGSFTRLDTVDTNPQMGQSSC